MAIILVLLFLFLLWTCQNELRFNFIGAWAFCGLAAVFGLVFGVYVPEHNRVHSIHEWQYMSNESWHLTSVILVAVGVVVYILFLLFKMTKECPRYDFLYAIFHIYFHIMLFSFVYKQCSDRFGLKAVEKHGNQHQPAVRFH
jgi:hypothetical protein